MEKDFIGLKIKKYEKLANCIKIIQKYTNDTLTMITSNIAQYNYVFKCDYIDSIGIKTIIKMYEELSKVKTEIELYELNEKLTTIDFVKTLDQTYDEIDGELGEK